MPLNEPGWTLFRACQQLVQATELGSRQDKLRRIWEPTYVIVYRERTITCDTEQRPSSMAVSALPAAVDDVLQLLRQLHALSGAAQDAEDSECAAVTHCSISPDLFTSKKITNKLLQQIQDALVLSSGSLPAWCEQLTRRCPFLFPFETRQLYLNCTAFGASRSIVWLQTQRDVTMERQRGPGAAGAAARRDDPHEFRVGRLKHERVKVPRAPAPSAGGCTLLDWAVQVMRVHADRKSILEVEFSGEEGTGLGPTLEFYALVAAELQRADLAIWLCDDEPVTESEEEDIGDEEGDEPEELQEPQQTSSFDHLGNGPHPPGYYVRRAGGLFPAPLPQDSAACERATQLFWFIGVFLAKVL